MIKQVIRLVKPGLFLPMFTVDNPKVDSILIRPRYLSICAADLRYFNGNRPPDVLAKKLPLALFHEAVGQVLYDPSYELEIGSYCILLPGGKDSNQQYSNYKKGALFRSSNCDGFCQETLYMNKLELISIQQKPEWLYVLTELMSVCCQALNRLKNTTTLLKNATFGIWGDGSMSYMMALTLSQLMPDSSIIVFGKHDEKLLNFSFCTKRININDKSNNLNVDYAFECVGGNSAQIAIKDAVDKLNPTGTLVLMGVSETPPIFPTRLILEKGITVLGTSRSVREDFELAKTLIDKYEVKNSLLKIVSSKKTFKTASELCDIFKGAKNNSFKTVVKKMF